eukprot:989807-Pelagomonas_calceolata.AAC.1
MMAPKLQDGVDSWGWEASCTTSSKEEQKQHQKAEVIQFKLVIEQQRRRRAQVQLCLTRLSNGGAVCAAGLRASWKNESFSMHY